jgi:uncharacterized damage-inducible protein DinB
MNPITFYRYLIRARQDLWAVLETTPDELLAKPILEGQRFKCLKDLIMHTAAVEDSWLHEDILCDTPVFTHALPEDLWKDGAQFATTPLPTLLGYWKAVQASTLAYLETAPSLEFVVDEAQQHTAHGLVWHFMLHEVRHTAQMALLLRQLGIKPPALDLLWYLPLEPEKTTTKNPE